MRVHKSKFLTRHSLVLTLLVLTVALSGPAYCADPVIALLLKQSPTNGGKTSPVSGLHRFALNSQVSLTALPRAGYQFGCWLGDVADPTSSNTTVYVNGPKIVVALFVPNESVLLSQHGLLAGGGSAYGGMMPTQTDLSIPTWTISGGGPRIDRPSFPANSAPVPEPTSLLLLCLGGLAVRRHILVRGY